MVLRRLGNKKAIAEKIYGYFPTHRYYIEPFFGAGGMFFSKPKAQYNILNDLDADVVNLFNVITKKKDELYELMYRMPIHEHLWHHWRRNREDEDVRAAVRFLFLSNFGYMGKTETMRLCSGNSKNILLGLIDKTYERIYDCEFTCVDFRDMLAKIPVRDAEDRAKTFIYCDPPYLDTTHTYQSGFTHKDSEDLFKTLTGGGIKFAMSEFDHPFIIEQARDYGLTVTNIGARQAMKAVKNEILITNYNDTLTLF